MKKKGESGFRVLFDVFFIMALCFATLLSSMLLNGAVIVGDGASGIVYSAPLHSVIIIVGVLSAYLFYLLKKSDTELCIMVKEIYDKKADGVTTEKNGEDEL